MNFKKIILSAILSCSFIVQSHDLSNEFGRTELMNYIIEQEMHVATANQKLDAVFVACFGDKSKRKRCQYVQYNGYCVPQDRYSEKNLSTVDGITLQMAQDLICPAELKLAELIEETVKTIDRMVLQGAQLDAKDQFGKMASDYCYTKEFYEVLRKHSASCSWQTWVYFNPDKLIFGSIGVASLVVIANCIFYPVNSIILNDPNFCVNKAQNRKNQENSDDRHQVVFHTTMSKCLQECPK